MRLDVIGLALAVTLLASQCYGQCQENQFSCDSSGQCIPGVLACDGEFCNYSDRWRVASMSMSTTYCKAVALLSSH